MRFRELGKKRAETPHSQTQECGYNYTTLTNDIP